jgi:hypothetical protein
MQQNVLFLFPVPPNIPTRAAAPVLYWTNDSEDRWDSDQKRNTALGRTQSRCEAANSGGTLVTASHEKCFLEEMVRGGLRCIRRLRYREIWGDLYRRTEGKSTNFNKIGCF